MCTHEVKATNQSREYNATIAEKTTGDNWELSELEIPDVVDRKEKTANDEHSNHGG